MSFELPARPIGATRGRGGRTLAAWVLAVGAIVFVGMGGRLADRSPTRDAAVDAAPTAALDVAPPLVVPAPSVVPLVVIEEPLPPPASITGIPIWVRGHAAPEVRQILLVLVDGETRLARQTVRPSKRGTFSAVFTLGPPRPLLELTVIAVGRDSGADAISTSRRAVVVSPLSSVAVAERVPGRLGEDGLLGSRGVDLAADEDVAVTDPIVPAAWNAQFPVGQLAWQANPAQR